MIEPGLHWFVSGHRPGHLGGWGSLEQDRVVYFAALQLLKHEPGLVYIGMAEGWDRACAIVCQQSGIPYVAVLPHDGFHLKWSPESQATHESLLSDADEVVYASRGEYAPEKNLKRNEYLVTHGNRGLVLWNGCAGGTGNTVRLARRHKVPIDNVWADWETYQRR